ncbi:HAD domain-containing protein (plasmid) [Streptosporangium sp. CA-135522]|uniref:HAD domain-containing protein n=1 Tax=Streptosporangium sp. CA-135522 TaxID=3240072 RepID=UPI003D8F8715
MTGSAQRPLLFLDVDGPLIPFGAPSQQYPTYQPVSSPRAEANPLLVRINPDHGARLMTLPCELVWATSWMNDANECIAPRLGLPPLSIVAWPDEPETEQQDERDGLHWKTRTLVTWAAGRPFAWIDDEVTDKDRAWVSAHHPGPALLHRIDPRTGLTEADYLIIEQWLHGTGTTAPSNSATRSGLSQLASDTPNT